MSFWVLFFLKQLKPPPHSLNILSAYVFLSGNLLLYHVDPAAPNIFHPSLLSLSSRLPPTLTNLSGRKHLLISLQIVSDTSFEYSLINPPPLHPPTAPCPSSPNVPAPAVLSAFSFPALLCQTRCAACTLVLESGTAALPGGLIPPCLIFSPGNCACAGIWGE